MKIFFWKYILLQNWTKRSSSFDLFSDETTFRYEEPEKLICRDHSRLFKDDLMLNSCDMKNYLEFKKLKSFWKTCKPCFSNKHCFGESKIALTEEGVVMTKSSKVAKSINS